MVETNIDFCGLSVEKVIENFDTNLSIGLDILQIEDRLKKYGPNQLPEEEKTSIIRLFVEQFEDTLVRILLFAAIVSGIIGLTENHERIIDAFIEPIVILIVLIVNAFISVRQTIDAEGAIQALKEYEPDKAKVLRQPSPTLQVIKASQLVVGDIVEIRVGDRVPADLRVCEIHSSVLRADQSILTGESLSVMKTHEPVTILNPVNQEKQNILFSGTNIVAGRASCVVVATGESTEIGKIRDHIANTEVPKTPLQIKLDEFGNQLSFIILIICILVWVINIPHFDDAFHGNSWILGAVYYFKIAISLAVAAIPEGLPAVITTCLAIGTRRMAKKNAIVRTLRSVETLGCTTVICSDKTGTITTNQMSVQKLFLPITNENSKLTLRQFNTTGTTYDYRDGAISDKDIYDANYKQSLEYATYICCMCNDSSISADNQKNVVTHVGEATEAALLVFAEKLNSLNVEKNGMTLQNQVMAVLDECNHRYTKNFTLEFTRDRKSMSVYCQDKNNEKSIMFVKGATEEIIKRCSSIFVNGKKTTLHESDRDYIINNLITMCAGKDTLRCLALAVIEDPVPLSKIKGQNVTEFVKIETNMMLIGIVGMLDPPRVEVLSALERCYEAGIRVIVITGDNKQTAEAICHKVGIFDNNDDLSQLSYSAREFDKFNHQQKLEACQRARLFSRVEPSHKSEIVKYLQELGEVTAMTGDGVNDAPALKRAEIGVAMGSGTAVAKSSADIVLADDNFTTIISAVFEGRAIFHNTVQFISYLISSNIGEVVCILGTSLLGLPECLIPVQLLWVNLITDGLPATALGFSPPPENIMHHPPRNPKKPMIGPWQIIRYCTIGLYVGMVTIAGSLWWYLYDPTGPQLTFSHLIHHQHCSPSEALYNGIDCQLFNHFTPMTISLSVLVLTEMFNACNSMSDSQSILVIPPWKNMFLILAVISSILIHLVTITFSFTQKLFQVASLSGQQWIVIIVLSFPVILLDEILKFCYRTYCSKNETKKLKST